jgi:hypothetical protein
MTDQEVLRGAPDHRRIHGGPRNANQTLTQLVAVLDRQDVAHAIERLEKGHEFRDVVK